MKTTRLTIAIFAALIISEPARDVSATEAEGALNLSQAVKEASEKNPEIQSLRQRVQSASARAKQAPYLEDPEVYTTAWAVPLRRPLSYRSANPIILGFRQKFPFFGKLGLKEKIAQQEVKVAEEELRAKQREIISNVKTAYADLFMAQKSIEIFREQSEIMRTITRATEARYQVGKVTQQDVFKSLLEQSEIMNQLIVAEEERRGAEVKLNALMFHPPQNPIQLPAEVAVPDPRFNFTNLQELALANRPELKGAEDQIERSEKMYDLADRNRKFPDFMVGFEYWVAPDQDPKHMYSPMLTLTIPFSPWTIGRRNYEVEETLTEIRVAKANSDATRNMTLREVGESYAKMQAATKSLALYREGILSQAELSFRAAMAAYQTGQVEFVNLLEAERALREARMGYYKSQVNLMQSLADLERGVGKELQ